MPAIIFSKELLQVYPEAKVILSTRDVDVWYASMFKPINVQMNYYPIARGAIPSTTLPIHVFHKIYNYFFLNSFEENGKEVHLVHNERITVEPFYKHALGIKDRMLISQVMLIPRGI